MFWKQWKCLLWKEMQGASSGRAPGRNGTSCLSDSARSRKNVHSHALLATFCNLSERWVRGPRPAFASNLLYSLNGPLFAHLWHVGFGRESLYGFKFLIQNTMISKDCRSVSYCANKSIKFFKVSSLEMNACNVSTALLSLLDLSHPRPSEESWEAREVGKARITISCNREGKWSHGHIASKWVNLHVTPGPLNLYFC